MTVLEYANDVDRSIDEIFKICQKMNIKVSKEDDMLSDDDIIVLDNELQNNQGTITELAEKVLEESIRAITKVKEEYKDKDFNVVISSSYEKLHALSNGNF